MHKVHHTQPNQEYTNADVSEYEEVPHEWLTVKPKYDGWDGSSRSYHTDARIIKAKEVIAHTLLYAKECVVEETSTVKVNGSHPK